MGTISHHLARAHEFLNRADRAIANHNPRIAHDPLMVSLSNHAPYHSAAAALRRAATHAVTALAVNAGWKHKSRFQLETVLHAAISSDTLSRSHLKTFRQAHDLPQTLSLRAQRGNPAASTMSLRPRARHGGGNPAAKPPAHPELPQVRLRWVEGCHPVEPCPTTLRRLRRRVASLIKAVAALIAGNPRPVRHYKRWQRKPDLPDLPRLTHVRQIMSLPTTRTFRTNSTCAAYLWTPTPTLTGTTIVATFLATAPATPTCGTGPATNIASPSLHHGAAPSKKLSASPSPTPSSSLADPSRCPLSLDGRGLG